MLGNYESQFRDAIAAAGLTPPEEVIADGKLRRFASNGKRSDLAGWYVLHDGNIPAGAFGDWRSGVDETWCANIGRQWTAAEQQAHRAKAAEAARQREAEEVRIRAEAAKRAASIWDGAQPAPDSHEYLRRKAVRAHGLRVHDDGRLIVPLRDADGALHSVQFVAGDGAKRFLPGGRVAGCFHMLGEPDGTDTLCLAEGYATAASIHEAADYAVVVCFNAGNLLPVSQALRSKYPERPIVICGDDDWRKDGNPGLTKAREAAQAIGARLAVPSFGADRPESATDMNDLLVLHGVEAVRAAIEQAREPAEAQADPAEEASAQADRETIARLAGLSPLEYDRERRKAAKALGVRPSTLDRLVMAERKGDAADDSGIEDVDPWPDPIDPAELLNGIAATVRRFIICDSETAHAVALWTAMTWLMDVVHVAPLAVITAPEKRCGKSLLLFLLGRLSCRPLTASNISPAALFRCIDAWSPTLLVDEADAFARENEELRGLLNCGHTRDGAYVVRTVGDDHTPRKFNTWGAKALAGIGKLADTLMDRAIVLELRRKLPHEQVERLRHAEPDLFETLAEKLARFAEDYRDAVRQARPQLPASLNDRAQDNWEPLLAIADVAGGAWPKAGREAALKLSGAESATMSTSTELLADIQTVFETRRADRISSADLIEALCEDDEAPWSTYNRGKPISPRQVAKRLAEYGIRPKNVRGAFGQAKGFEREQFTDAFSRYLSTPPPQASQPSQGRKVNNGGSFAGTDDSSRYGNGKASVPPEVPPVKGWDGGTDKKGGTDSKKERDRSDRFGKADDPTQSDGSDYVEVMV